MNLAIRILIANWHSDLRPLPQAPHPEPMWAPTLAATMLAATTLVATHFSQKCRKLNGLRVTRWNRSTDQRNARPANLRTPGARSRPAMIFSLPVQREFPHKLRPNPTTISVHPVSVTSHCTSCNRVQNKSRKPISVLFVKCAIVTLPSNNRLSFPHPLALVRRRV